MDQLTNHDEILKLKKDCILKRKHKICPNILLNVGSFATGSYIYLDEPETCI